MIFDVAVAGRNVRVEVQVRAPGADGRYRVTVDGETLELDLEQTGSRFLSVLIGMHSYDVALEARGSSYRVCLDDDVLDVALVDAARGAAPHPRPAAGPVQVTAPMPGKIVRLLAQPGARVAAGAGLVVMEAMKMENELRAPREGRLREVVVEEGQTVETGALLALID